MIVSFEGEMGKGMRLTCVGLAWLEHEITGKGIITNYSLGCSTYNYFTLKDLINGLEEIDGSNSS